MNQVNEKESAPSTSGCSTLIDRDWLVSVGFEQMFEGSFHWYSRKLPFVTVVLCDSNPELRIGSSAFGWHVVTKQATQQDVIALASAMKCLIDT